MTEKFRALMDNLFFVHIKCKKDEENENRFIRRVVIDNEHSPFKYTATKKRILTNIVALSFSYETAEYYPNLKELFIFNNNRDISMKKNEIDKIARFNDNIDIFNEVIPDRCIGYILYMLSSFFYLNDLLNDFYLIFGRRLDCEKNQLLIQSWDSIIKDDFILSILLFGLDNFIDSQGNRKSSKKYFDNLIENYKKYQDLYIETVKECQIPISNKFRKNLNAKLVVENKEALEEHQFYNYMKNISLEEIKIAKKIITSLFALKVSSKLTQQAHEGSILREMIKDNLISFDQALDYAFTSSRKTDEYQHFELESMHYNYINPSIAKSLNGIVPEENISPFPLPLSSED